MYIWNIEQLKNDIRKNRLTEKDRFIYLFINLFFTACALEVISFIPGSYEFYGWAAMSSISNVTFLCIGTYAAYKANGGSSGDDFLGRYFSLSFVVSVRFVVLLILIVPIKSLAFYFCSDSVNSAHSEAVDTVINVLWSAFLYANIYKQFKAIQN